MKKYIVSGALLLFILTSFAIVNPRYGYAGETAPEMKKPALNASLQGLLSSAKDGDALAQLRLGFIYHKGRGIARDYEQAFIWYEKSALQGNAEAQFRLGEMYYNGQGLPRDYKQAFKWFKRAALLGYAEARFNLGILYANGDGVPRDYVLSYVWFNLSGAKGYEPARLKLDRLEAKMPPKQVKRAQKMSMQFTKR